MAKTPSGYPYCRWCGRWMMPANEGAPFICSNGCDGIEPDVSDPPFYVRYHPPIKLAAKRLREFEAELPGGRLRR